MCQGLYVIYSFSLQSVLMVIAKGGLVIIRAAVRVSSVLRLVRKVEMSVGSSPGPRSVPPGVSSQ